MSLSAIILFLAQATAVPPGYVLDPPPCPDGRTECKPWERQWYSDPIVKPNPFDKYVVKPRPERLGAGPHTLVISDRDGMTRIDYPTGARCLSARDAISRQTAPPPNTANIIYGPSTVKAFCVPR